MNDPNGLIYFNGRYHVFYQWHPDACVHGLKYWGHFTSPDLLHWRAEPVALHPDTDYESHGCYSGCAVEDQGRLALLYTGNAKYAQGVRSSTQCLATSENGLDFQKHGPVILAPPVGYTAHFRDPKVWYEAGMWWMVIGAQTTVEKGTVLLYKGASLTAWSLVGEVLPQPDFGYMCECPDFIRFDQDELLIFCPQGLAPEGLRFHNIYQAGYLIGKLDRASGVFSPGNIQHFQELDCGFDFYAPQTFKAPDGSVTMIAWMGLPEEENTPTVEHGWTHCLSLPRHLSIEAGQLRQRPVPALKALRGELFCREQMVLEGLETLPVQSPAYELSLALYPEQSALCGIDFFADAQHALRLRFDVAARRLVLDRSQSGAGIAPSANHLRHSPPLEGEVITLQIFVDRSCIEIFINDGQYVMSARCYAPEGAYGLRLFSSGRASVKALRFWPSRAEGLNGHDGL